MLKLRWVLAIVLVVVEGDVVEGDGVVGLRRSAVVVLLVLVHKGLRLGEEGETVLR